MAVVVEVEQHGDNLAIILPTEALAHLRVKLGETLEIVETPNGLLLKAYDAEFEAKMASLRHVMDDHKEVLRMLAE